MKGSDAIMDRDIPDMPDRSYFFDNGLLFECRRCGGCCTGSPGIIRVDDGEMARIALFLGKKRESLLQTCFVLSDEGFRIREDSDGACVFYRNGCTIYPVRPVQCSTYPFWFRYLRSEEEWRQVAAVCPGIGTGRIYSKEEILALLAPSLRRYLSGLQRGRNS